MQSATEVRKKTVIIEVSNNELTKIRNGSMITENGQLPESELKRLMEMPIRDLLQHFPYPPSQIPSINSIRIFKAQRTINTSTSMDSIELNEDTESPSQLGSPELKPASKASSGSYNPVYINPTKRASRGTFTTSSYDPSGSDADLDLNTMELVLRGCKGVLGTKEEKQFLKFLTDNDEELVKKYQIRAHQILADRLSNPLLVKSKEKIKTMLNNMTRSDKTPTEEKGPPFSLNKFNITFYLGDDAVLPLHTTMVEKILLTNKGIPKAKFTVSPVSPPESTFTLTVNPSTGVIKKKTVQEITIEMYAKTTIHLNTLIMIDIEGGFRFFLTLRLNSAKSVFGVPVNQLELVDDEGYQIPKALKLMKSYLKKSNALIIEGIFRVQGDDTQTQFLRNEMNDNKFVPENTTDPHCVASLIKIFYRELPQTILRQLPKETLLACAGEKECLTAYNQLEEPNQTLMSWLLDLMAEVASYEEQNKMNARNLAIVLAPNLFRASDYDPRESMQISQKVVTFCNTLIIRRMRDRAVQKVL